MSSSELQVWLYPIPLTLETRELLRGLMNKRVPLTVSRFMHRLWCQHRKHEMPPFDVVWQGHIYTGCPFDPNDQGFPGVWVQCRPINSILK